MIEKSSPILRKLQDRQKKKNIRLIFSVKMSSLELEYNFADYFLLSSLKKNQELGKASKYEKV